MHIKKVILIVCLLFQRAGAEQERERNEIADSPEIRLLSRVGLEVLMAVNVAQAASNLPTL